MRKISMREISLVVGGICIGSGTTYLLIKNRLTTKYDQLLNEEIKSIGDAASEHIEIQLEGFKKKHKLPPYDVPTTAIQILEEPEIYNELVNTGEQEIVEKDVKLEHEELVQNLLYKATEAVNHEVHPPSQAQKIVTLDDVNTSPADIPVENIFANFKEVPQEILRDKAYPYIVSEEEFRMAEPNYNQMTLLYYAGDDQLADENGGLVPDVEGTIGVESLKHFGHDENNPNTLFVRNDLRETDFEVIRLDGTHGEIVLGIAPKD